MPGTRTTVFEPRTVDIRPPSLRSETTMVARLAMVIIVGVGFYLANTVWNIDPRSARVAGLLPYQTLVTEAAPTEQRMFRELQEGLLEAERLRSSSGAWPSPAALADMGVPPFAADPTERGSGFRWLLTHRGAFVNYRGIPSGSSPSWLGTTLVRNSAMAAMAAIDGRATPARQPGRKRPWRTGRSINHVENVASAIVPAMRTSSNDVGWIQLRVNAPTPGYVPPPPVKTQ